MATLTQVARLIKSELVLVSIIVLAIVIFALAIFGFISQDKTPKTPPGTAWQDKIYPGNTNVQQLESTLGQPQATREENGQIKYFYSSGNEFLPHEVSLSNNTVSIIKEQVIGTEKGNLDDYRQKFAPEENKIFGEHGTAAPGYFWGQRGILVFANQFDGTIMEIWYFEPTTISRFLSSYPELSLQEPRHF